jgi:hypothetical protein
MGLNIEEQLAKAIYPPPIKVGSKHYYGARGEIIGDVEPRRQFGSKPVQPVVIAETPSQKSFKGWQNLKI